jgi:hypothetical protein
VRAQVVLLAQDRAQTAPGCIAGDADAVDAAADDQQVAVGRLRLQR